MSWAGCGRLSDMGMTCRLRFGPVVPEDAEVLDWQTNDHVETDQVV